MPEITKYKVVLSGTVLPDEDREQVIRKLSTLFHSKPSYMEKLLNGQAVALKKQYGRTEAEKICRAVRNAGAQCKLKLIQQPKLALVEEELHSQSNTEQISGIICPHCHEECDSDCQSCDNCGYSFVRKEADSGFSYSVGDEEGTVNESSDDESVEEEYSESREKLKRSRTTEIVRFIGPNANYYIARFRKLGTIRHPKFRVSWHWPALFAFFFWALYRKMWFWAIANQVSTMLLMSLTRPSLLWVVFGLVWPLCANYLYFRHTARHVMRLSPEDTAEQKQDYLIKKGGVSKLALWAGIGLTITISMFASNRIATEFLQAYNDQYGTSQNGISQMRGDGSLLTDIGVADSQLAKTSKALGALATSVKVIIGAGNEAVISSTLASLMQKSDAEKILDAWGNPIFIEQEPGRLVFVSMGADGVEKTNDDILQIVNY